MAFPVKEGVLFKKIHISKENLEFDLFAKEVEDSFKKNKISKQDIHEAIEWAKRE